MKSQFIRFGLVGTIGFFVDTATLYFFVYVFNVDLYVGRIFSYTCAVSATWLLNRLYTFQSTNEKKYQEWARFAVVNMGGGIVNFAVYSLLITQYDFIRENLVFGVAIGSLAGLIVNFYFSKKMVFSRKQDSES